MNLIIMIVNILMQLLHLQVRYHRGGGMDVSINAKCTWYGTCSLFSTVIVLYVLFMFAVKTQSAERCPSLHVVTR